MMELDRASPVRNALDLEVLEPWLRTEIGLEGEIAVRQFAAGFSNLTYLLEAGARRVVLRRPPPGADVKGGHDMGREVRLLTALRGHVPVPKVFGIEDSGDLLGAPFYVMEHVEGVILRSSSTPPGAGTMASIADAFLDTFTDLHRVDLESAGLTDMGQPEGYVRRQVEGWTRRYVRAATDDTGLEDVFAWLDENQPTESGAALIHNDFKYDNLVLSPDLEAVRAVLDWELATVGDPLMDLGSTLGYWVEPGDPAALRAAALSPTWWPGNPTRQGVIEAYQRRTGLEVGQPVFYAAYGFAKLAVIAQQIYKRWTLGHATDPRFSGLIEVVKACSGLAARAIDRDRISDLG